MADARQPVDRATDAASAGAGRPRDVAAAAAAGPAADPVAASSAPAGPVEPSGRGFPGFPAGDPRQLPLSQRPRGLDAPAVPGGGDPELRVTIARERPYVRLLVGMVAVIVGGSLILTFLAIISAAVLR